jgi:GDP-D-mannose dehydratase
MHNNLDCTVGLLEMLVELGLTEEPFLCAPSWSIYGNIKKIPFHETEPVVNPASLYAVTK